MLADVSLAEVGRALQRRSHRLAFSPALEARFEADTSRARARMVVRQNKIGIVVYNSFLIGDWLLIPDIFTFSVVLHLAVMTPLMLLVNHVVSRQPPAWLRESILAFGIVAGTEAILTLTLMSRSPLRFSEHLSSVLVILFATMVQRIRFTYVLGACLASLALYVFALMQFAERDWAQVAVADAVFAGVVLFSLMGCYTLEAELRLSYLLGLRDKLRNLELEAISCRDALTGVGNRRALEMAAHDLAARSLAVRPSANSVRRRPADGIKPGRGPCEELGSSATAVLLLDIDHFKSFNDANGHIEGDTCLKRVAALIDSDLRLGADRVFRFGGEEFLVLLEDTGLEDALRIAERICRDVETAAIPRRVDGETPDGSVPGGRAREERMRDGRADVMTLSVGVAAAVLRDGVRLDDLIADADAALYRAKSCGRNQVWPRIAAAATAPVASAA